MTDDKNFIARISFSITKHNCMARTQIQAMSKKTNPIVYNAWVAIKNPRIIIKRNKTTNQKYD